MDKGKISGPVSAFYTEYEGKVYNFYGDKHYGFSNICQNCTTRNKCWDVIKLLDKNFADAEEDGKYIDFYLEIPFIGKKTIIDKEYVKDNIQNVGYILKIWDHYFDCFTKSECHLNNTRFHYTDMRKSAEPTGSKPVNYEHLLYAHIYDSISTVLTALERNTDFDNDFEDLNILIQDLYFNNKNYLLMELILTSDNYIQDFKNLFSTEINKTKFENEIYEHIFDPDVIVYRDGKVMHRVRTQLYELEKSGKTDMAKKIIKFILDEYKQLAREEYIKDLWASFRIIYSRFSNRNKTRVINFLTDIKYNFKKTMRVQTVANTLIMDAYTLARMFRKFNNESSKVIVYAGSYHINTYVKFFEFILKTKFVKNENVNRCLNVDLSYFL